jgi:hypothetical protein
MRSLYAVAAVVVMGCSRTSLVIPAPAPQQSRASANSSTAATLKVPPGHMPQAGECRIWIPGTPPGRQPRPKSRSCAGIASVAPAGSWVIYRPTADRKVVHVRHVDNQRVVRVQIFDIATQRLVREERP